MAEMQSCKALGQRRQGFFELPVGFLKRFFGTDAGWILLLWLLSFTEHFAFTLWDHAKYSIIADAVGYYQSGLDFIRTGRITYSGCPTALIMPGISVLIGLVSLFFADGPELLFALRIVWIFMGSFVPPLIYRALRLYTRRSAAFLGSLVYLLPWQMEIDCFLLTEGPYSLFFVLALYFTLKLGEKPEKRDAWGYALSVLAGLMFRAAILVVIFFSFAYWLLKRIPARELLRRALVLCLILSLFIVPWSIRNWRLYHAFIPVTYGAGNPFFEGTYQGENPPTDQEIGAVFPGRDVYAMLREKRPDLLDENGKAYNPELQQYVNHLAMAELGRTRFIGWWKLRPLGLLKSYLYVKPRIILNWVWYNVVLFDIPFMDAHRLRQAGFLFCVATVLLSFSRRRLRTETLFLFIAYMLNLLLVATSYAIDRYGQMIMPYRFLLMGLGWELIFGILPKKKTE